MNAVVMRSPLQNSTAVSRISSQIFPSTRYSSETRDPSIPYCDLTIRSRLNLYEMIPHLGAQVTGRPSIVIK